MCAFDFAGSGLSEGNCVSFGYFEKSDIGAVVEHLRKTRGINEVILWGRSMGAVAALLYAGGRGDIRAIVADSPFTSMRALLVDIINSYIPLPNFLTHFIVSRLQTGILEQASFDIL